ncbi:hypothetical protein RIR_jg35117.t1 [Rhizophagus irregularis DAOM 181602=DAOM 197198]|nr:hypothetical protein RIR_jg35117.t1 [Rhizophagus irregularis DAOM 181602=DAOM 197198]
MAEPNKEFRVLTIMLYNINLFYPVFFLLVLLEFSYKCRLKEGVLSKNKYTYREVINDYKGTNKCAKY